MDLFWVLALEKIPDNVDDRSWIKEMNVCIKYAIF